MRTVTKTIIGAAALVLAAQAHAAPILLTFDDINDPNPQPACTRNGGSGPTTTICSVETTTTGNDYGSTPELAITYNRVTGDGRTANGRVNAPNLLFLIADGNGVGSSFGSIDSVGNNDGRATITFTPTAGNQVSFAGFDFIDRNTAGRLAQFTLTDADGGVVFDFTSPVLRTRTSYVANTGFFSGPLTLTVDGLSDRSPSFDNIALNTRLTPVVVPPVGGVPEPAAWALMIAGFGLTGTAMRRRASHSLEV